MTDRQIIEGSTDYYKKVELIRRPLLNYAKAKIYGAGNAEDVVQNTILILCQKINHFDPNKSFNGWAFRICNFQIKKYLTKKKRNREDSFEDSSAFSDEEIEAPAEMVILEEDSQDELDNIELLKSKLPPKQLEVFTHILNGTSRLKARRALGMKETTFNTTYFRTIKNCQKILANERA